MKLITIYFIIFNVIAKSSLFNQYRKQFAMRISEKTIVALFADIRGFSHMFEILPPEKIYKFTNRFFQTAYKIIKNYHGTLDNIVGDGLLAIWGKEENIAESKTPFLAVRAAIEMRMALLRQNIQYKWEFHFPLEIGIGIDMGKALHCLVGPKQKPIDTFYGIPVIVASRLGDMAKNNQIFVSKNIIDKIKSWAKIGEFKESQIHGFKKPITYATVQGIIDFIRKNGERREKRFIRYVIPEVVAMIMKNNGIRKPVILKNISETGAGLEFVQKKDIRLTKDEEIELDLKRIIKGFQETLKGKIVNINPISNETDEMRSLWQVGIKFLDNKNNNSILNHIRN